LPPVSCPWGPLPACPRREIGFVSRNSLQPRPCLPVRGQIGCVSHDRPDAPSPRCPSMPRFGFVLRNCPASHASVAPPGVAGYRLGAPLRAIGFVFPMPLVGTSHHNSFHSKNLPFVSVEGKLGLFDAYDKSRGGEKFTISLYVIWIYVIFCVDRPGAGFIL